MMVAVVVGGVLVCWVFIVSGGPDCNVVVLYLNGNKMNGSFPSVVSGLGALR